MEFSEYGPLKNLIGLWESPGLSGENQAPDPDRQQENTKFRQIMEFTPIGQVDNHEQMLFALRYHTKAWEEGKHGENDDPFHEEVGYFIWDQERSLVMKSFIVPRGIAVNAGGRAKADATQFTVSAELGSPTYGISSNEFLDQEFKTLRYDVTFKFVDEVTINYFENTQIKIKGQAEIFNHIEKNTLKRK